MQCFKVTDKLLRGLDAGENDVFIVNFAAPDMVAHTGNLETLHFRMSFMSGIF